MNPTLLPETVGQVPLADAETLARPDLQADAEEQIPDAVAGHRVEAFVGRGGMGVVWRVRDEACARSLAVKILRRRFAGDAGMVARFLREARFTAMLQHPAVLPVHAVGLLDDGRPYFVMKYIAGRTLKDMLAAATTERGHLLTIFEQVAQAVAYAHGLGVIHRDLKPDNVMVGAFGEVQVMDWGLAKKIGEAGPDIAQVESAEETGTRVGSVLGTLAYMPPEQARGEAVDARADVFGLGAMLCEILTGSPPLKHAAPEIMIIRARKGIYDGVGEQLDASGEEELAALASRCLSPARTDRPADAGEVAAAVAAYREATAEKLRAAERENAANTVREAEAKTRRKLLGVLAAVVLAALVAGGAVRSWAMQHRAATRAQAQLALEQVAGFLDRGDLDDARPAVANALTLVGHPGTSDELVALARERERQVKAADHLEEIRTRGGDSFGGLDPDGEAEREYAAAFAGLGVDFAAADRSRVTPPMTRYVLPALDDWTVVRIRRGGKWDELLDFAAALDPDPWRDAVREAMRKGDAKKLRTLAESADVSKQPPSSLAMLASRLAMDDGGAAPARSLLSRAAWQYPDDVKLLLERGKMLCRSAQPTEYIERLRAYTALLALRPTNAEAWAGFGSALEAAGRPFEAFSAYQRAGELRKPPAAGRTFAPVVSAKMTPSEKVEAARQCAASGVHAEAVRLFREAFAADPARVTANRYRAARSAFLAGDRAAALAWMREEVEAWGRVRAAGSPEGRAAARSFAEHAATSEAFAPVREGDAAWAGVWEKVRALRH